jgi:phosphate:Na+ symporter
MILDQFQIFQIAGGMALLLFSMKIMSTGLELAAGDRLQVILKRATSNRFLAVFVGIVATIALTSSTAVTIITVGFVNSGLMSLTQSIGVIMGANVGTTFSAQLIAFRIDAYAPLFIFVGAIMYLFFKKKGVRNIGYVVLGFGILFFSISVMSAPLRELSQNPEFNTMLVHFENPLLALFVGFAFTAIVQSSSAATGLLVTMHLSGVPLSFETSAFIILGTNIGTCITTVLASIPASRDSKRAALFHVTYSVIGSIVFGLLIVAFPAILNWFETTWANYVYINGEMIDMGKARQVAMFHTLFNVATLLLLLPFVTWIALLMQKIIPLKEYEKSGRIHERKLLYLDVDVRKVPAFAAVSAAHLEVCRMGKIANENLALSLDSFYENSQDKAKRTLDNEKVINFLYHQISAKMVEINNMALSSSDAEKVGKMFKVLSDIERVGDHAENIAEYTILVKEGNLKISDTGMEELRLLGDLTTKQTVRALNAYEKEKTRDLPQIKSFEKEIDRLSIKFAGNHIERLKEKKCDPKSGAIFIDMITDLERSADHAKNIAFSVLPAGKK